MSREPVEPTPEQAHGELKATDRRAEGDWHTWRNPGEPLVVGWMSWRDDEPNGPALVMPDVRTARMVAAILNAAEAFPQS